MANMLPQCAFSCTCFPTNNEIAIGGKIIIRRRPYTYNPYSPLLYNNPDSPVANSVYINAALAQVRCCVISSYLGRGFPGWKFHLSGADLFSSASGESKAYHLGGRSTESNGQLIKVKRNWAARRDVILWEAGKTTVIMAHSYSKWSHKK